MNIQQALTHNRFDTVASEKLTNLVRRYCAEERNPSLPRFVIHGLRAWDESDPNKWNGSAESGGPGVYVIYDARGNAIYLGKASCGKCVGDRLRKWQKQASWTDAAFVQIVEVTKPFEAPSLEEYLLAEFPTVANGTGVIRRPLQS